MHIKTLSLPQREKGSGHHSHVGTTSCSIVLNPSVRHISPSPTHRLSCSSVSFSPTPTAAAALMC